MMACTNKCVTPLNRRYVAYVYREGVTHVVVVALYHLLLATSLFLALSYIVFHCANGYAAHARAPPFCARAQMLDSQVHVERFCWSRIMHARESCRFM